MDWNLFKGISKPADEGIPLLNTKLPGKLEAYKFYNIEQGEVLTSSGVHELFESISQMINDWRTKLYEQHVAEGLPAHEYGRTRYRTGPGFSYRQTDNQTMGGENIRGKLITRVKKYVEVIAPAYYVGDVDAFNNAGRPRASLTTKSKIDALTSDQIKEMGIYKFKFSTKQQNGLAQIINRHMPQPDSVKLAFVPGAVWSPGVFDDSGSCFWGAYKKAIPVIYTNGGGAVIVWRDNEPIARCWYATVDENIIMFNGYSTDGHMQLKNMTQFVASLMDKEYGRVAAYDKTGSVSYNGDGYIVGDTRLTGITFDWEDSDVPYYSPYTCGNCDKRVLGKGSMYELNGTYYCEDCQHLILAVCPFTNDMVIKDDDHKLVIEIGDTTVTVYAASRIIRSLREGK